MPLNDDLQKFYQSSSMREGILCWYPFESGANVLDLSGGTLTELLKNHCGSVRHSEAADGKPFDYIVVIDPADFSVKALKTLRSKLGHEGRLLLAYENPFALRYWTGKRAPSTGIPYDTLFCKGQSALPSRVEMQIRLKLAGFEGQKWYYPLTDHWLTTEVYSESYLPDEYLNQRFTPYIADDMFVQFDERNLYREMIRGGAFEFMCGAYLVEARVYSETPPCHVDYATITAYREPAKRFTTIVRNDGIVYKKPLHHEGRESVRRIYQNHIELAALGVDVVEVKIENGSLVMPRQNLPTLWDYWTAKLSQGVFDEDEMISNFDRIRNAILKASVNEKCYWELVPANCFYDAKDDRLIFFDQEYAWENASADIALIRAIKSLNYSPAFQNEPRSQGWIELLKERYSLSDRWDNIVDTKVFQTFKEVFGPEYIELQTLSNETARRISRRRAEMLAERKRESARYDKFYPVIRKLRELEVQRPVVYGYGQRGKTLKKVFDDNDIRDIIFIDQKSEKCKSLDDLTADIHYDAVIVSILHGDEVADGLRGKTHVPVYTLGELVGEQIE